MNKKTLKFIFLYSVLFLMIMLSLALIVNTITNSRSPSFFPVSKNNDWIGFYGNLIGSFIGAMATIFIFKITINHSEEQDKHNHRIQVIPFVYLNILEVGRSVTPDQAVEEDSLLSKEAVYQVFSDKTDSILHILHSNIPYQLSGYESMYFELKNIGAGLATNIGLESFGEYRNLQSIYVNKNFFHGDTYVQPNNSIKIYLVFPLQIDSENEIKKELKISYLDILGNWYSQSFELAFQKRNILENNGSKYSEHTIYIKGYSQPILQRQN